MQIIPVTRRDYIRSAAVDCVKDMMQTVTTPCQNAKNIVPWEWIVEAHTMLVEAHMILLLVKLNRSPKP